MEYSRDEKDSKRYENVRYISKSEVFYLLNQATIAWNKRSGGGGGSDLWYTNCIVESYFREIFVKAGILHHIGNNAAESVESNS